MSSTSSVQDCSQLTSCDTMTAAFTISKTRLTHARELPISTPASLGSTPLVTHRMACMNNNKTSHMGCKHELQHLHHPFVAVTLPHSQSCIALQPTIPYYVYIVFLPCDVTCTSHLIIHGTLSMKLGFTSRNHIMSFVLLLDSIAACQPQQQVLLHAVFCSSGQHVLTRRSSIAPSDGCLTM